VPPAEIKLKNLSSCLFIGETKDLRESKESERVSISGC